MLHGFRYLVIRASIRSFSWQPEIADKELCEDESLEWYDYGARMYDVQIGRWTTTDPEWQYASPYVYCGNNAVNYIDPDGRESKFGNWILKQTGWKGTKFDKWLSKNEGYIVTGLMIGAGIALSATGIGAIAAAVRDFLQGIPDANKADLPSAAMPDERANFYL